MPDAYAVLHNASHALYREVPVRHGARVETGEQVPLVLRISGRRGDLLTYFSREVRARQKNGAVGSPHRVSQPCRHVRMQLSSAVVHGPTIHAETE